MPVTDTKWLEDNFAPSLLGKTEFRGELTYEIQASSLRAILQLAKKQQFDMLIDLFGVDYLKYPKTTPERFAVIYNLYSLPLGQRIFFKVWVNEDKPEIESVHDIYKAVNWFEREAWDLYGIIFKGHPNLTRILCHHEFQGHPLRKDYPADGYQQLKTAIPSARI